MARSKKHKKAKQKPLSRSARPARPLFRLIPMTMLMAFGLFGLKVIEIIDSGKRLRDELIVSSVEAEDVVEEEEVAEAEDAEETDADEEAEDEEGEEETASDDGEEVIPPVDIMEKRQNNFSAREVDVLESLAKRREKLEAWEKEMALKEKVLEATETRIEMKIAEMNKLSGELKELLVAYEDEEDAKIRSLVKIYEAMKPKEAAPIFEQMDMEILLMVIDRMSERRVAPILAKMSPGKARMVTEQLAEDRLNRKAPPPSTEVMPPL